MTGAGGTPPPEVWAHLPDHKEAVALTKSGRNVVGFDHLVVYDDKDTARIVRLNPNMSPEALQAAVKRLGFKKIKMATSHFDKKNGHIYLKLFSHAWPEAQFEQKPDTDAGEREVHVELKFVATDLYFRAIAKIAFHYYLTQSIRSLGNEDHFRDIRDFIMHGGGKSAWDRISRRQNIFGFPQFPSNMVPSWWHHILTAAERDGTVFAMVCLFYGPEFEGERYTLELGKIPSRIVLPKSCWGHAYDYDRDRNTKRFAGKTHPLSISALR